VGGGVEGDAVGGGGCGRVIAVHFCGDVRRVDGG